MIHLRCLFSVCVYLTRRFDDWTVNTEHWPYYFRFWSATTTATRYFRSLHQICMHFYGIFSLSRTKYINIEKHITMTKHSPCGHTIKKQRIHTQQRGIVQVSAIAAVRTKICMSRNCFFVFYLCAPLTLRFLVRQFFIISNKIKPKLKTWMSEWVTDRKR